MKINFPKFRKSTGSYQTINQACRSIQAATNKKISFGTPTTYDYVSFLNRETNNKNWFKKMCRTVQIIFGKS